MVRPKIKLEPLRNEMARELGIHDHEAINRGGLTKQEHGKIGGSMVRKMVEAYQLNLVDKQ